VAFSSYEYIEKQIQQNIMEDYVGCKYMKNANIEKNLEREPLQNSILNPLEQGSRLVRLLTQHGMASIGSFATH